MPSIELEEMRVVTSNQDTKEVPVQNVLNFLDIDVHLPFRLGPECLTAISH